MGSAAYTPQAGLEEPEIAFGESEHRRQCPAPAVSRTQQCFAPPVLRSPQTIVHRGLEGHVKLWNQDRGFGFLEAHNGLDMADLFVHVSGLAAGAAPREDDVVTFDAALNEEKGGLQAVNVRSTGASIVRQRHTGIIVHWKSGQFGFIEAPGFQDNVFAHSQEVVGHCDPEEDDEVTFEVRRVRGRAQAIDVRTTGVKLQSEQSKQRAIEAGHSCGRCGKDVYDCPCRDCSCLGCTRRDEDDRLGPNVGMSGDPGAARRRWLRQLDLQEVMDRFY